MSVAVSSIALITKYSTEAFDKVYKVDATSSILATGSNMVQFTGAKSVKVAKITYGGLNDYNRPNSELGGVEPFGYQSSGSQLTWEDHILSMDRAASYVIEEFDNEESGDMVLGHAVTEVNRTKIIPEVDAYCWSKIYSCAGHTEDGAVTAAESLAPINKAFLWLEEHEVPVENQVILISPAYMNLLRNNHNELTHFMQQGDWSKDVSFRMTSYEGRKLVVVPPQRFMTKFDFISTGGIGYRKSSDAKPIDFIVMDKTAAVHITKFQKTRILSGDVATAMANIDGYVLLARIYHDVIVFDNKRVGIYAHVGSGAESFATDADAGVIDVVAKVLIKNGKVNRIFWIPGDQSVLIATAVEGTTYNKGDTADIAKLNVIREGDTLAAGTAIYAVANDKTVVFVGTASAE